MQQSYPVNPVQARGQTQPSVASVTAHDQPHSQGCCGAAGAAGCQPAHESAVAPQQAAITGASPEEALHQCLGPDGSEARVLQLLERPEVQAACAVTDEEGTPPLVKASELGYSQAVHRLLQLLQATDVNKAGRDGATALITASAGGHAQVVEELTAARGINANQKDESEWTALHYAARRGHAHVIRALLRVPKIDVNACSSCDCTPLHLACEENHVGAARELLQAGADTCAQECCLGYTPIDLALELGHKEVLRLMGS